MEIIKYGDLFKGKKKVKAKYPYCDTKVLMTKEDYVLYNYQTNMVWTCPFCDKKVTTKRFNKYRFKQGLNKFIDNHECIIPFSIIIVSILICFIILYILVNIFCEKRDSSDRYLISYTYNGCSYNDYVDDYDLNGTTLSIYDNGEKTIYYNVAMDKIVNLMEENNER